MSAIVNRSHYVPCVYLKNSAASDDRLFTYRVLVSQPRVQVWKQSFPAAVGYYFHLYTRIAAGGETDEVENHFNRDFETPAKVALVKATHDERLRPTDWYYLVRFLAAQDVRTPASLIKHFDWMRTATPALLEGFEESVRELEEAKKSGKPITVSKTAHSEYVPIRFITEKKADQAVGKLKVEVLVGRGSWLFCINHLLTHTAKLLLDHKWTILRPPEGVQWFTSDDPVVCLNYHDDRNYDFNGGWGSLGTEIFLPLGPRHLLYTKVGHRVPQRGSVVTRTEADLIRRYIAEHAHRLIFAAAPEPEVPKLRPRLVDAARFRYETDQWRTWHDDQGAAEREFWG
jgi:hypothetical protein